MLAYSFFFFSVKGNSSVKWEAKIYEVSFLLQVKIREKQRERVYLPEKESEAAFFIFIIC